MAIRETALRVPLYRKVYVRSQLNKIERIGKQLLGHSDDQLRAESLELAYQAKGGSPIESYLPRAYAVLRESSRRVLGLWHYDVQIMAGINLASKCIVEMATGEGKTLTALLPLYLHALRGKGAHLATANDYLARRDGEQMRPLFSFLGMSLGTVQNSSSDQERRAAYHSDITYCTLNEVGFDFLRDRMKTAASERLHQASEKEEFRTVGRNFHFILVDEADSIMIDDASTPLIIGAPGGRCSDEKQALYRWAAEHAPAATEEKQYHYIQHEKKCELTEQGRDWARSCQRNSRVSAAPVVDAFEYLERAIKVERDYELDKNYVVHNGQVHIVDENTGRVAVGRFWQDGLHQAIQAREDLEITTPNSSAARVTLQSLVMSYPLRAGMTGTASSSKAEFRKTYKMNVVSIPTRKPCIRRRSSTRFASSQQTKLQQLGSTVKHMQAMGRPVLVGSRTVAKSELISAELNRIGVAHSVLNARNEELEASIVAEAGQKGRVTISTSMAGRGTDIVLGDGVKELGGLYVIIAELNDSRRVDRQLIGRCARQGDPGGYQLFLALDDEVMDFKHGTTKYAQVARYLPALSRERMFRLAQRKVNGKAMRLRLAMLHHEKKRLRSLRQAGLDPVLDVEG